MTPTCTSFVLIPGQIRMSKINCFSLVAFLVLCAGCQGEQKLLSANECPVGAYNALLTTPMNEEEVDSPAKLKGGFPNLVRQIRYPESAKRERVQGEVWVQFVVDEEGCVINAEVLSGPDDRLNAEALRVIQHANFEPAKHEGTNVAMIAKLPVSFRIK